MCFSHPFDLLPLNHTTWKKKSASTCGKSTDGQEKKKADGTPAGYSIIKVG